MSNSPSPTPWNALPVVLAGAFMVVLDFFIVNVALPSIANGLHAGSSSLEWVVSGYGLSFAVTLVVAGRSGDELGRRRMFAIGTGLFVLASAACGAAPNATLLIIARVAQGMAGAVLFPQVLSILGVNFRGADYGRALSAYGVVLGLGAVGGQIIGGALVQLDVLGLGWRGCFLINVPVGLLSLALTFRLVPESRAVERTRLDLRGALFLAVGLVAVLLPLIDGRSSGWAPWTWASFAACPVVLGAFLAYQRRLALMGRTPLLDLKLFARRAFSAGIATQICLASAQASFFVYLALYLQDGRGLGALDAGLLFAAIAVPYVVTSGPAPALTRRFGRGVIAIGGMALTTGFAVLAVTVSEIGTSGSVSELVPGLLLVGAGIGLCYTPLTSIVLEQVDPRSLGSASGAMSTAQQVGYALGVALTGVIFFAAKSNGVAHAFEVSLLQLTALAAAVVLSARLLPPTPATAGSAAAPALAGGSD